MNAYYINILQQVKNTGGCASRNDFIEDNEPVGEKLLSDLLYHMVEFNEDGKIVLTDLGERRLAQGPK